MQTAPLPLVESSVITTPSATEARDIQYQIVSDERELKRQQWQFGRVLQQIQGATALHRRLISFLVDHEPQAYEVGELDRLLTVSAGTTYKNPPTR